MAKTSIEWTDFTVNPIRARFQYHDAPEPTFAVGHHCEKISLGCTNCYASNLQKRFRMPEFKGVGAGLNGKEVFLDKSKLNEVLSRKKPTKFFWFDCTDPFGSWVKEEWLDQCFAVMALTRQHTHQILTKRPERMLAYFKADGLQMRLAATVARLGPTLDKMKGDWSMWSPTITGLRNSYPEFWPLRNVWLGVSVEDQQRADERIPLLLQTPAAVRFLSCEPLLGPVSLDDINFGDRRMNVLEGTGCITKGVCGQSIPNAWCNKVNWVIIGGESGHNARPCHLECVRSLVQQCQQPGTPVFVKQLGSCPIGPYHAPRSGAGASAYIPVNCQDPKGGNPEEWPEDLRVRQFPGVAHG